MFMRNYMKHFNLMTGLMWHIRFLYRYHSVKYNFLRRAIT